MGPLCSPSPSTSPARLAAGPDEGPQLREGRQLLEEAQQGKKVVAPAGTQTHHQPQPRQADGPAWWRNLKLLPTSEKRRGRACPETSLGAVGSWDQTQFGPVLSRPAAPGPTQGPTRTRRSWCPGQASPARRPPGPPCRPLSTFHPRLGAPGWVAAARGGADWFRFQIWPRPGLGAQARLAALRGPAEGG